MKRHGSSGTFDSGLEPARPREPSGEPVSPHRSNDRDGSATHDGLSLVGPGSRCRGCGYRLRGLSVASVCPECGRSIEASLRGDQLIYADPAYLKDLSRGVVIIQVALALATLSFLWWIIGLFIPSGERAWYSLARNAVSSIVMFIGLWLFSRPDPGLRLSDPGDRPRRILRGASLIVCFTVIGAGIGSLVIPKSTKSTSLLGGAIKGSIDVGSILPSLLDFVGMIAWIVQFFAAMLYVQWLARRMPSRKLHRRAGRAMWLLPILYITQVLKPVAYILYFILIDELRVTLHRIRSAQSSAAAPGAATAEVAATAAKTAPPQDTNATDADPAAISPPNS